MRTVLLVACIAICFGGHAFAEWADDSAAIAKAESLMVDFIATKGGPSRWAAFGRGESWALRDNGHKAYETKFFTMLARSKADPDARYFSHGIADLLLNSEYQGNFAGGTWFQTLSLGNRRFQASGPPMVKRFDEVDDKDNYLGTTRKRIQTFKPFNPFTACVAPLGALLHGSVDGELPERLYMLNAVLARAEVDEFQGLVKGAWVSPGVVTVIVFDRKANWLPVEMTCRLLRGEADVAKLLAAPINSRVRTQWQPVRDAAGELVFLPARIRFAAADGQDGDRQSELVYSFQWRIGESVRKAFPRAEDADWREPMRQLFDEDFSRMFDPTIDLKSTHSEQQ